MTDITANLPNEPQSQKKSRSIWFHLHFWIGWIAALPIALVCLTGALLIFEGPLFQWENKALFTLEPSGSPLSIQAILDQYSAADPPYQVNHLGVPNSPTHSYGAYCTELHPDGNRGARVFINPYTGELTKMGHKFSISHLAISLHRNLATGAAGKQIVAVSSLILAITSILGLVLWWPLRGRTFSRALKRGRALDWHNALGLIALLPLFVMSITGITFTWGSHVWPTLDKLQGYPSVAPPPALTVVEGGEKISIDPMVERIRAEFPNQRITGIQPGSGKLAPVKIFLDSGGTNFHLIMNPYTGQELARVERSQRGIVGWYRGHFGRFHTFGPYNLFLRIVWGLLSLSGAILVITGIWVSMRRWSRRGSRNR